MSLPHLAHCVAQGWPSPALSGPVIERRRLCVLHSTQPGVEQTTEKLISVNPDLPELLGRVEAPTGSDGTAILNKRSHVSPSGPA